MYKYRRRERVRKRARQKITHASVYDIFADYFDDFLILNWFYVPC